MARKRKVDTEIRGDPKEIILRLKQQLAERDQKINRLENRTSDISRSCRRIWLALEEAWAMADRFPQFVQDAVNDPKNWGSKRAEEMRRYKTLFKEAQNEFLKLQQ